ncbi:MAG: glycosyltransferase family 39 protein [Gemmatimonadaceae bacterium]|nr:glycosyltransferase family 39 protein [Gemmatimonadaceae bacterium]
MSVYESTAPRGGGVTVAAVLVAVVTVTGLFTRPLLAIDETRYAAVALEMLQRNDWLVPHLNGATYSHKPPLLFWLVAAGWKVFGVSEAWARLVGPLAGVVALALLTALARALWPHDARTRGWAPVITVGALLWAAFGTLFMFDTLLACCALLALLGIVHAVEHGNRRGVFYLAAGITLGVLSKGPVILLHVLPVALAAPWWATPRADRRWATWYVSLLGGLLLGVCGALLWAIPAGVAGGAEYQRAIFLGQTTGRIANSFAHRRGIWWYLPLLPALLFPWFLWPESWRALSALRQAPRDAGVRFCVAWAGAALVLFSLVSGKQVHYLVPIVPAVALLLARGLSQREAASFGRPWLVALVLLLLGAAVIAVGVTPLGDRVLWWPHATVAWGWALVPMAAAVMLVLWVRGRITRNAAVHTLAVSTTVLLAALQLAIARQATVPYDTAPMAAAVRTALRAGRPVAMLGSYHGEYHFPARLRDVRIEVLPPPAAATWLAAHRDGLLLRYDRGRDAPVPEGSVERHPFRNGWVSLSRGLPAGGTVAEPAGGE